MWAFNLVPLVFFLFNSLFFDVFFFRLRLSLVFSFFLFDTVFFFFCLAVIRFFVGVLRGGGPPVVRHSSVGSLGSTGADMMKEWRGAGSRIRGSRQKYDT